VIRWSYARSLDDAAADTAVVIARLGTAWADATGREWAERLRLVGRELDHAARAAMDLAGESGDAADTGGLSGAGLHAEETVGVVLGAQTGTRTTDRRGVVVPTLHAPVAPS
jgi:hypothetical protein